MATRLIPPVSLSYMELFVGVHALENHVSFIFSADGTVLLGIQHSDSIILTPFHGEDPLDLELSVGINLLYHSEAARAHDAPRYSHDKSDRPISETAAELQAQWEHLGALYSLELGCCLTDRCVSLTGSGE
jgi:hypothetical protein